MLIVDAHLDLAYNATRGRDPRMPASQQPVVENEIATVGLPDLRAGNVGLVCATIFCEPKGPHGGYTTAEEARQQALTQLAWYRSCVDQGLLRFALSPSDLPQIRGTGFQPVSGAPNDEQPDLQPTQHGLEARATGAPLAAILLLEGADAIRSPDDLPEWHAAGLRIVGLAWKRTRFAGGTGAPGPLTAEGR
jgi:membrane dipeptidase